MTAINITSAKGASITLTADTKGFVSAHVNGNVYNGDHKKYGVMVFGSNKGDYLRLSKDGVSIISQGDVGAVADFCAAARRVADAAELAATKAEHAGKMASDPVYARTIHAYALSQDMGRANSTN